MKNILLTSAGLTAEMQKLFFSIIEKEKKDIKVLFIPSAATEIDNAREGIAVCVYELIKMGIIEENIFDYDLKYILSSDYSRTYSKYIDTLPFRYRLCESGELLKYDAVFVCGGYSEHILVELNRTGFDKVLIEAVNKGLFYVGVSAGSMVAAGNFETGMHLINNSIEVHCDSKCFKRAIDSGEYVRLSNTEAIYVTDDTVEVIG